MGGSPQPQRIRAAPAAPRIIITRLIVFLLLGAIVNVAVAWGCGAWWPAKIVRSCNDSSPLSTSPGPPHDIDFTINTLFYAGILWLLFAAPFALRRRWRIKRGLCPKCAYPVGESPVCTECGAPMR